MPYASYGPAHKGKTPVLPCWYCEGRDDEDEPYSADTHDGWDCEACDERRTFRAIIEELNLELYGDP